MAVREPSSTKVKGGTGVILLPEASKVSFTTLIQPGKGGGVVTVTVAAHCTVPPGPVAVPVYVVSVIGDTLVDPESTGVTDPMA